MPSRSAGHEAGGILLAKLSNIQGIETIHIFARKYAIESFCLINVSRQGSLNQYSVHCGIRVQNINLFKKSFFADIVRQEIEPTLNTDPCGSFLLFANVGNRCRLLSDSDEGHDRL